MATIWISEFDRMGDERRGKTMPITSYPNVVQVISFTAATTSGAFGDATYIVRLIADADFHVNWRGAAATAADEKFMAGIEYFRGVHPGNTISVYDGVS